MMIGSDYPIRIQSMTTVSTLDTDASVDQAIRIINAGGEMVRFTAPNIKEAENLENIKNCISQKKFLPINYFYKSYDSITGLNKKYDAIFCGPILNYIQNLDLFFNSLISIYFKCVKNVFNKE